MLQQPYLPPPILPSLKKNKVSMLHLGVHKLIPLHLEHRWESWERKRCRLSRKYRRCTKFRLAVWKLPMREGRTSSKGVFGDWNASYLGNLESLQCFYAKGIQSHGIWIFIFSHSGRNEYSSLWRKRFRHNPWKTETVQFWSPICQAS